MIRKIKKANIVKGYNNAVAKVSKNLKNANNKALKTTEEITVEVIEIAEKWQKVNETAIKGGLKLLENQQDLVFTTLEAVKGQFIHGKKRFGKLFA